MPLVSQQTTEEPRYDAETLRKVTALAQRLQAQDRETLTAQEMEQIGAEVGLNPNFMRKALAQVTATARQIEVPPVKVTKPTLHALMAAWWAAGWTLPFLLMMADFRVHPGEKFPGFFFLGWGIYLGVGVFFSKIYNTPEVEAEAALAPPQPQQNVSRAALLDALFTIQGALDGQKQHYSFLSVDVAGSSGMKHGEQELAVEYSFLQLQNWLEETVRAYGGELHSAAGDGMMCIFNNDAAALRAARALQAGLPQFNVERNRLSQPFRLRCGVSAGDVALDRNTPFSRQHSPVIDRAANLQKSAQPGDIVVSSELAAAGLVELGGLAPLPNPVQNEPAFSWRAAQR